MGDEVRRQRGGRREDEVKGGGGEEDEVRIKRVWTEVRRREAVAMHC